MSSLYRKYAQDCRFDWSRKPSEFAEVLEDCKQVQLTQEEASQFETIDLDSPFDYNVPEHLRETIFIARNNGNLFLVNPEGFSYCRYVAPIVVEK